MKKSRSIITAMLFVLVVIIVNNFLNFALVQPGLTRVMFKELKTEHYDCLVLGASHGSYGLSSEDIKQAAGMTTMNMCIGGEYMVDSYYILKYAVKYNKPKVVLLDIDYQYLVNRNDESILFHQVYNGYPACVEKLGYFNDRLAKEEYRGAFLKWTNYWQCYKKIGRTIQKKTSEAYKNYSSEVVDMDKNDTYVGNGFISKSRAAGKSIVSCLDWEEGKISESECEYIKKMVELCRENDIPIIFTTVVQDPRTVAAKMESFVSADTFIRNLAEELNVEYYNFNCLKFDVFPRTENDFWDREGHMYGDMARAFSKVYGEVINQALQGTLQELKYFDSDWNSLYKAVSPYN